MYKKHRTCHVLVLILFISSVHVPVIINKYCFLLVIYVMCCVTPRVLYTYEACCMKLFTFFSTWIFSNFFVQLWVSISGTTMV